MTYEVLFFPQKRNVWFDAFFFYSNQSLEIFQVPRLVNKIRKWWKATKTTVIGKVCYKFSLVEISLFFKACFQFFPSLICWLGKTPCSWWVRWQCRLGLLLKNKLSFSKHPERCWLFIRSVSAQCFIAVFANRSVKTMKQDVFTSNVPTRMNQTNVSYS